MQSFYAVKQSIGYCSRSRFSLKWCANCGSSIERSSSTMCSEHAFMRVAWKGCCAKWRPTIDAERRLANVRPDARIPLYLPT